VASSLQSAVRPVVHSVAVVVPVGGDLLARLHPRRLARHLGSACRGSVVQLSVVSDNRRSIVVDVIGRAIARKGTEGDHVFPTEEDGRAEYDALSAARAVRNTA